MISKTIGYNGVHNIFRHTHYGPNCPKRMLSKCVRSIWISLIDDHFSKRTAHVWLPKKWDGLLLKRSTFIASRALEFEPCEEQKLGHCSWGFVNSWSPKKRFMSIFYGKIGWVTIGFGVPQPILWTKLENHTVFPRKNWAEFHWFPISFLWRAIYLGIFFF